MSLVFTLNSFPQSMKPWENPDYGSDSISRVECAYNLSTLSEFMKINLPDYALPSWRNVFRDCPASSKNVYILGSRIFCYKIENEENEEMKKAYYDTLMMLHDKRIEYFGEEGLVLGRKGMDVIKYAGQESFEEAYTLFKKSLLLLGPETEANVLIGLSETGFAMYNENKIGTSEFLEDYVLLTDILENQLQNPRSRNRANLVIERLETNLSNAGISNCSEIEKIFRTRMEKSPEDEKTLKTVSSLLKNAGCEKEEFYRDVYLNIFNINPTAENAAELTNHFIRNDDYVNAVEYMVKTYELENNNERKAQYALQLSLIYYSKQSNFREAANYAIIASEHKPEWAEPYFILASSYVEGFKTCANDAFERSTIFWLAADLMEKAARVDPSAADKAKKQLIEYQKFFPQREEAFFRSLQEGSSYLIGCWINRNTKVRFN